MKIRKAEKSNIKEKNRLVSRQNQSFIDLRATKG